jgi:hypothetical protein
MKFVARAIDRDVMVSDRYDMPMRWVRKNQSNTSSSGARGIVQRCAVHRDR